MRNSDALKSVTYFPIIEFILYHIPDSLCCTMTQKLGHFQLNCVIFRYFTVMSDYHSNCVQ